ncbi:MAG: hypothetical protein BVN32_12195 [Proteobacteria bacterium ST_bin14]|nr:MAG: hypothetical protein BVN32_12195 [Proteobacteria bacterium ST_bin14]
MRAFFVFAIIAQTLVCATIWFLALGLSTKGSQPWYPADLASASYLYGWPIITIITIIYAVKRWSSLKLKHKPEL